jgi:hypothetical protein
MSLCSPERDKVPVTYWGLVLNPRWVQDLTRDNVPCLKSKPDITLPNPQYCGLYQDDALSPRSGSEHQRGECGRKAGRGREIMSATAKQRKTRAAGCYLETRGGSPNPEVKTANEMTCDYVWDKP